MVVGTEDIALNKKLSVALLIETNSSKRRKTVK